MKYGHVCNIGRGSKTVKDLIENIRKISQTLPIFIVSGKDDPVGDMGSGVEKVYHMFQEAGLQNVAYKLYENDRHEILNETDKEQVFEDIFLWLQKCIG